LARVMTLTPSTFLRAAATLNWVDYQMSQLYDREMRHELGKERLLKLTLAVYKVTAVFPPAEAGGDLGLEIRDLADKILANLLLNQNDKASSCIEEMLSLFGLAEEGKLADKRNFLVLRQEYDRILKIVSAENALPGDNHRLEKILAALNSSNGMMKIGDLIKFFPGVNRRTVLRDLDKLCQDGFMVRNGTGRGVYYVINGQNKCDITQKMSQ